MGVQVAQWAKRPPLKLEVSDSNLCGWFNSRAGNRDPFCWLETARGLSPIGLIGRVGRPRGTVGKASASEARGTGFEPPWLVQWSRWESRPLLLVRNGAGAVALLIDRRGSVFPRGTGRFLVEKGVHIASFRCLSEETLSCNDGGVRWISPGHDRRSSIRKPE